MKKSQTIHVISGTHWDREWRYTADQSLLRLAHLMDGLLDILEKNTDYPCFHLDGGTVVIEDYLAIRPENTARLRQLIQQGRIQTVLWYTLPEMSSVHPEALIRNLLIGKRLADQFGGAMQTGYTATSYGQISQLPQIYAGFGMDTAVSYRGTNKHQVPPICRWQSPDGTQIYHIRCFDEVTRTNWFFFCHYELVLGKTPRDLSTKWKPSDWPVHMADDPLYETAFQLKNESLEFETDPQKVRAALEHMVKQAKPQMIGAHILALDMEDNASPYAHLPRLIAKVNEVQKDYLVKQSSLDEYVHLAKQAVAGQKLPVQVGEMRFTAIEAGFNGLLGTTHSSRVNLKLMNDEAETELIALAEPLSSFSALLGGAYEHTLLQRAWLELLKNHAHDSICGAAIDLAHKDNPARYRAVTAIARECSRQACEEVWLKLDTQRAYAEGDITLTFFNTLPTRRTGVQAIVVDLPNVTFGDLMIEPCTGVGPILENLDPDQMVTYLYFDLFDEAGNKVPYKLLEREKILVEVERKLDSNAAGYDILRHRLLVEVDLPPCGYRTYALRPRKRKYETNPQPGGARALLAQPAGMLENEYLRVTINPNGTFDLTDKQTGKKVDGLHYFCDNGSCGMAHVNKTPLRDYTVTSLGQTATLTLLENNSLRATWRIDLTLPIPAAADLDSRNRTSERVALPITTLLTLRKGSRRLEIKTHLDNQARDHRLRVLFPTDIQTDYAYAGGPFDVLQRSILWENTAENLEGYYPFKPMRNFVTVSDEKQGFSFLSKGLQEYEVLDDPRRTLAITLLRTSRQYMMANRGLFTPEEYTHHTGQHCLGTLDFEYALYCHAGNWAAGRVLLEAEDFKTPLRVLQAVPKAGERPATDSFLTLSPVEHVHVSALYKDKESNGYILRLWNSSPAPVAATLTTALGIKAITKITMDQQTLREPLTRSGNSWAVPLGPMEIVTLLLQ